MIVGFYSSNMLLWIASYYFVLFCYWANLWFFWRCMQLFYMGLKPWIIWSLKVVTQASLVLRFAKNSLRYRKIKPATIAKLKVATEMLRKHMPYQLGHGLTYAIEVISTVSNGDVICWCKFCVHEGCDEVEVGIVGRKCKQCSNI